jgi:hypothetical protein
MKIIFAALALTGFALGANAQVAPNALQNTLKDLKPNLLSNTVDKLTLSQPLTTPGNYFTLPRIDEKQLHHFDGFATATGTQTEYSRMPIAHLQSNDRMPILKLNANGYTMLVKPLALIDPAK